MSESAAMACNDGGCTGQGGFGPDQEFPELPAGSRYCPFCGNELDNVDLDDEDED